MFKTVTMSFEPAGCGNLSGCDHYVVSLRAMTTCLGH